jgi:hypothetical protein
MRFNASRKHSASPHRLDDFYAVAIAHDALRVLAFRYDLTVDLDGNTAPGEVRVIEQRAHAQAFGHFARFAIEQDFYHVASLPSGRRRRSPFATAKKQRPADAGRWRVTEQLNP